MDCHARDLKVAIQFCHLDPPILLLYHSASSYPWFLPSYTILNGWHMLGSWWLVARLNVQAVHNKHHPAQVRILTLGISIGARANKADDQLASFNPLLPRLLMLCRASRPAPMMIIWTKRTHAMQCSIPGHILGFLGSGIFWYSCWLTVCED
jgi:hypothetical protein